MFYNIFILHVTAPKLAAYHSLCSEREHVCSL